MLKLTIVNFKCLKSNLKYQSLPQKKDKMKIRNNTWVLVGLFAVLLVSCGQKTQNQDSVPAENTTTEQTTEQANDKKEFSSKYICPMHCAGSGSDTIGVCPECGMEYVLNRNLENEENHEGHDHGTEAH